jgi:hypothetical protein
MASRTPQDFDRIFHTIKKLDSHQGFFIDRQHSTICKAPKGPLGLLRRSLLPRLDMHPVFYTIGQLRPCS